MTERPCPEGWERRERLYPVGSVPGGEAAILKDALERIATAIDGLDSASPDQSVQRAYEAFVLPHDDEKWRVRAADDFYSCALVGVSLVDCLGGEGLGADEPYEHRVGRAVTDFKQLGKDLGGWVDTTIAGAPLPTGPFVGLVGNNGNEGAEHVFVGLDGLDDDQECHVVEGGQPTATPGAKGYRIARGVYDFEARAPGQIWARRIAPKASAWRRLRGYVDLTACAFDGPVTLPA